MRSLDDLAKTLPLEIIRNNTNKGFASACNQGARNSDSDFILFLNPDTRLTPGALEAPAQYLMDLAHDRVGIVGIQLLDQQGNISRTCARKPSAWLMIGQSLGLDRSGLPFFPTHFLTDWDHRDTRIVDQVMGAFFFVRRSLFEKLKGFDERFFVYFEELDFAVRALEEGATSIFLSTARAFHQGSGTTDQVKDLRLYYWWRSRIRYAHKHFSFLGAYAATFVMAVLEPVIRTAVLLAQMRLADIRMIWLATRLMWANFPAIMRGDGDAPAIRSD